MAKSDFVCKICKQVRGRRLIGTSRRYHCPKHGQICGDHIYGMINDYCKDCQQKVIRYTFNSSHSRYEKA